MYDAAGVSADSTASADIVLSPAVIDYLSTVVHEAMHHWSRKYGGFDGYRPTPTGTGVLYGFNFAQLAALDLAREQSASAVASAFILKWQLHHGAEMVALRFVNFGRFSFNGPPNDISNPYGLSGNPFGKGVASSWGDHVNRTLAGSILWFFNPLLAHVGS